MRESFSYPCHSTCKDINFFLFFEKRLLLYNFYCSDLCRKKEAPANQQLDTIEDLVCK